MPRRVLLIDDDRMQSMLTKALFGQFRQEKFELEWVDSYEKGLDRLLNGEYAACLLDYQLGEHDGLSLLRKAVAAECHTPIIFLTAETGENIDMQAMDAGAMDYLIKGEINPASLERSLRYALKLGETLEALRMLATHDALTGLLNRREFDRIIKEEHERAKRFGRSYAIIILDIDHFKLVNDRFGHDVGDVVLKRVCERVRQRLRTMDVLCRLGGEEFIVLAPGVRAEQAAVLAEALWQILREEPIEGAGAITASFGVTDWRAGESAASMLTRVDAAVYQAKQEGRDRVVIAP